MHDVDVAVYDLSPLHAAHPGRLHMHATAHGLHKGVPCHNQIVNPSPSTLTQSTHSAQTDMVHQLPQTLARPPNHHWLASSRKHRQHRFKICIVHNALLHLAGGHSLTVAWLWNGRHQQGAPADTLWTQHLPATHAKVLQHAHEILVGDSDGPCTSSLMCWCWHDSIGLANQQTTPQPYSAAGGHAMSPGPQLPMTNTHHQSLVPCTYADSWSRGCWHVMQPCGREAFHYILGEDTQQ